MSNLEKYNQIFIEVLDVKEDELNSGLALGITENWDSLGHIALITEIENVFEIMFETEEIINFGSYENGKKVLVNYGIIIKE